MSDNDIVARLLALHHPDAADGADEIERLREAGDALAEVADEWPELVEAWQEARRDS